MSAPAGYTQLPTGEFMKDSDGSGPYVFSGSAMLLTSTGTGGGGGGGGGDASAANQSTQITAANLTNTDLGGVTETAPASDTASSGLNGRLQRIAQRLTSLITALGSPFQAGGALGAGTALIGKVGVDQTTPGTTNKVSIGTDGTVAINAALPAGTNAIGTVAVYGTTSTRADKSGTVTTGGTAQTIIASNASRRGFEIQNQSSGNLYFSTLATAVVGQPSVLVAPGALYETPLGGAGTGAVSLIGATTGQAFAAREWT